VIDHQLEKNFNNSVRINREKAQKSSRFAMDERVGARPLPTIVAALVCACLLAAGPAARAQLLARQTDVVQQTAARPNSLPTRITGAHRFLAERGWNGAIAGPIRDTVQRRALAGGEAPLAVAADANLSATPTWQPVGPAAVETPDFGLVTGRVAAVALDPGDATGNRLYVGTTGGGVWVAQNAGTSNPSSIVFTPLTDTVGALSGATDASISIGALTVQPGGTGVILAGTGDPNDVLDSYYGAGILRSTDGGNSWSLISRTSDVAQGLGVRECGLMERRLPVLHGAR